MAAQWFLPLCCVAYLSRPLLHLTYCHTLTDFFFKVTAGFVAPIIWCGGTAFWFVASRTMNRFCKHNINYSEIGKLTSSRCCIPHLSTFSILLWILLFSFYLWRAFCCLFVRYAILHLVLSVKWINRFYMTCPDLWLELRWGTTKSFRGIFAWLYWRKVKYLYNMRGISRRKRLWLVSTT